MVCVASLVRKGITNLVPEGAADVSDNPPSATTANPMTGFPELKAKPRYVINLALVTQHIGITSGEVHAYQAPGITRTPAPPATPHTSR